MRVSFRFLICCLRVCRTVDPAGITLSLVCWAPIVRCPPDYCNMPLVFLYPLAEPPPAAYPGRPDPLAARSPARRHPRAHFTSGTREAPPASLTSRSCRPRRITSFARDTANVSVSVHPASLEALDRSAVRPIHIFTCQLYPLSLSLAAPRHI